MVNSVTSQNTISLNDFLAQNANIKPPANTPSLPNTPAVKTQDTYAPSSRRTSNNAKQILFSFLKTVLIIGCASFILGKIADAYRLFKMKNGLTPEVREIAEGVWDDISQSRKMSDLSLPDELVEITEKIKQNILHPEAVAQRGGKPISSMLIYGPAGTGKTTFAKALANMFENAKFAVLDVTSLESKFVGESEKNINAAVDEICRSASENPAQKIFVFIDEIDSVMMVDNGSNAKYSNNVLNEFKKCFTDKLGKHDNIITIGATNLEINPERAITLEGKRLDKPMLDRFNQKIYVGLPKKEQIKKEMINHYKNCPLVGDELKSDSEKLDILCKFLSDKKRKTSFRTLNALYDDAASLIKDDASKVGFKEFLQAIANKKEEFNLKDGELDGLTKALLG